MYHHLTEQQIRRAVNAAAFFLADYCRCNSRHYVVTGSSGGLDSAVTLGLAQEAQRIAEDQFKFKLVSVGLTMPCHSTPDSLRLGRYAIDTFGAKEIHIDLSDTFDFIKTKLLNKVDQQIFEILERNNDQKRKDQWDDAVKVAQGNIKARLRMALGTYHVARMMGGLVLSTDNLSEYWMGFWTLCGDVGDFGMIQNVLKGSELPQIAKFLGVPQAIIDANPDDGNGVAKGGDAGQLGADYPTVDKIMLSLIQQGFDCDGDHKQLDDLPCVNGVVQKTVLKIAKRSLNNSFKRNGTINLSRKQLGLPALNDIQID